MDIMCTLIAVSHSSSWISLMYIVTCHDHSSATIVNQETLIVLASILFDQIHWSPLCFLTGLTSGNSSNSSGLFLVWSVLASTTSLSPVHLHEKQAHKVQHVLFEERRGCTVAFVFPRIHTYTSFLFVAVMVIRKICKNISLRGSVHISTNHRLLLVQILIGAIICDNNDNIMGRHF